MIYESCVDLGFPTKDLELSVHYSSIQKHPLYQQVLFMMHFILFIILFSSGDIFVK